MGAEMGKGEASQALLPQGADAKAPNASKEQGDKPARTTIGAETSTPTMPAGWEELPRQMMVPLDASVEQHISLQGGGLLPAGLPADLPAAGQHLRDVQRLPRVDRAWHVATTSGPPAQYANQLCAHATEWHPLNGFVRAVVDASLNGVS